MLFIFKIDISAVMLSSKKIGSDNYVARTCIVQNVHSRCKVSIPKIFLYLRFAIQILVGKLHTIKCNLVNLM